MNEQTPDPIVQAAADLAEQRFRLHTEIMAARNNVREHHRVLPDRIRERLELLDVVLGVASYDIGRWVQEVTE